MNDPTILFSTALRTLLHVAETSSFSRTARELGVRQSTVSRRIRDVEDLLGVSIYERYSHGVIPTLAGRAFLEHAFHSRDTLRTATEEAGRAGTARSGELRLGFVWSFSAGPAHKIVMAYRQHSPLVHPQLTELGATELLRQTLAREIDCAWIVRRRPLDPVLEIEPLWREPLFLAYRAGLYSSDPQEWSILTGQPFLTRSSDSAAGIQRRLDRFGGPKLQIHAHECSQESLLSLVAAGDGVTVLPESIAKQGYPGVEFAPMRGPGAHLDIVAIWRRETDNPALRRFMALTRAWLRKNRPTPPDSSAPV